jgi:hypothetical protein
MHLLDYLMRADDHLKGRDVPYPSLGQSVEAKTVRAEYRLLCSGTLFPAHIQGDWARSDNARILLHQPFALLVASLPFNEYPQELALRFDARWHVDDSSGISHHYYPDEDIARDAAALLTLFSRRLVTVSAKVRELHDPSDANPILADFPFPLALHAQQRYWPQRPARLLYGPSGAEVKSYHPPPVAFDARRISQTLRSLPRVAKAQDVVRAARLYALAMEAIETEHQRSYQLLISAAETMAGAVLKGWEPPREERIALKHSFVSYATEQEKLSSDVADRLALVAAKDHSWTGRKFKKFLCDYSDKSAIEKEDDLFVLPPGMCPDEDNYERAIADVYASRSSVTHSGRSFPASAAIGPYGKVPAKAYDSLFNQQRTFPPIGWFERVVSTAICSYIGSEVARLSTGDGSPNEESE